MKMLKWALLGGAAFAVSATAAQADDLAALKAQLESLQARVSQLEAQPAPSVPEGYQLVSISDYAEDSYRPGVGSYMMGKGSADRLRGSNGTTISIFAAADVAPSTQVVVSGQVRTVLFYEDNNNAFDGDDDHIDVTARGRLVVEGTTETAVGKVFVHIRLQGGDFFDATGNVAVMNEAYGTWEFMPGWQLLAGRIDNTAAIQAGIDWVFQFNDVGGVTNSGLEQMRLTYTTGPISWAVAVEDTDEATVANVTTGVPIGFFDANANGVQDAGETVFGTTTGLVRGDQSDIPAFAGYAMYNQDGLLLQVTGAWQEDDVGTDDDFFVGAGADFSLSDMFRITAAFGYGDGYRRNCAAPVCGQDTEYWGGTIGAIVALQDDLSAEVGFGYSTSDVVGPDPELWGVTAGVYWTPVDQLTLGWQAAYNDNDLTDENFIARFATWFRF
jgi:hypothetical protein